MAAFYAFEWHSADTDASLNPLLLAVASALCGIGLRMKGMPMRIVAAMAAILTAASFMA